MLYYRFVCILYIDSPYIGVPWYLSSTLNLPCHFKLFCLSNLSVHPFVFFLSCYLYSPILCCFPSIPNSLFHYCLLVVFLGFFFSVLYFHPLLSQGMCLTCHSLKECGSAPMRRERVQTFIMSEVWVTSPHMSHSLG